MSSKSLAVVLAAAALLALPGVAHAQTCPCRQWTGAFDKHYRRVSGYFDRHWRANIHRGLPAAKVRAWKKARKPVKRQLRSFGKTGRLNPRNWCKRHPKECYAWIACAFAGAQQWANDSSPHVIIRVHHAINACVAAAATVMLAPGG